MYKAEQVLVLVMVMVVVLLVRMVVLVVRVVVLVVRVVVLVVTHTHHPLSILSHPHTCMHAVARHICILIAGRGAHGSHGR